MFSAAYSPRHEAKWCPSRYRFGGAGPQGGLVDGELWPYGLPRQVGGIDGLREITVSDFAVSVIAVSIIAADCLSGWPMGGWPLSSWLLGGTDRLIRSPGISGKVCLALPTGVTGTRFVNAVAFGRCFALSPNHSQRFSFAVLR